MTTPAKTVATILVVTLACGLAGCGTSHRATPGGGNNGISPSTTAQPSKPASGGAGPATGGTTTATTITLAPFQTPGTPQYVAARYVNAAYSSSYTDTPGAWEARTRPYDTPAYYTTLEQQAAAATGPHGDQSAGQRSSEAQIKADHQVVFVNILDAQLVPEAPHDATSQVDIVTYSTTTNTLANPDSDPGPAQYAQLQLDNINGTWGVTGELNPNAG